MNMRRMLILHASVGTGHTTAARALAKVFRMRQVEQVWCEDALDYGSKIFREIYAGSYLELSEKMPTLWAGAARAGQPHAALKVAEAVLADHHAA
jgi:processive 1,2-diacylglycerol beta-glucosyltransferase